MAMSPVAVGAEARARSTLVLAGALSALGIAVAGTVSRTFGGVLLVGGWLLFVYALHSFGRAGSELSGHDSGDG
jgi:hypothetical protein